MESGMLTMFATVIAVAVLAMQVYTVHKIRRITLNTWNLEQRMRSALDNLFRQWEALHSIYVDLGLERSLAPTRKWAGSPDFLAVALREVRQRRPKVVVECSSGVSTVVVARMLQLNGIGHVYSLEHEAEYAARTREELERHNLSDWATVIHAPLVEQVTPRGGMAWYGLGGLPGDAIDMVIIDGPPEATGPLARYPAGPLLFPRLAQGACVLLDDADRPDECKAVELWQGAFTDLERVHFDCEKGLVLLRRTVVAAREASGH